MLTRDDMCFLHSCVECEGTLDGPKPKMSFVCRYCRLHYADPESAVHHVVHDCVYVRDMLNYDRAIRDALKRAVIDETQEICLVNHRLTGDFNAG